jgi:hypothetical protein
MSLFDFLIAVLKPQQVDLRVVKVLCSKLEIIIDRELKVFNLRL